MAHSKSSIVVLQTSIGQDLVIRSGPSNEEVRSFVEEHTKRYNNHQPGGPAGHAAYKIYNAVRFTSEESWLGGEAKGTPIKVDDLIPTP